MSADWPSVLDEVERQLALSEKGIAEGRYAFEPVAFPSSLGPLPAECRVRAESLHADTVAMQRRVTTAMEAVSSQLRRRPSPVATRPAPSYVDRLA